MRQTFNLSVEEVDVFQLNVDDDANQISKHAGPGIEKVISSGRPVDHYSSRDMLQDGVFSK